MLKLRFSEKEVKTPLTAAEMTAQLAAVSDEEDVETAMLKTFKKDDKGFYLQSPKVEMEPGMVPLLRRLRRVWALFSKLRIRRPGLRRHR